MDADHQEMLLPRPLLIGVKAIIAKSFERIHRSNLVGMGLLPLQFKKTKELMKLESGTDQFSIIGLEKINNDNKSCNENS